MAQGGKLLLHVCCGPCATAVIERLAPAYDLTCLWYNPNIEPLEEYNRRLEAARTVAASTAVRLVEGPYDNEMWRRAVAGYESEPEGGARCAICFRYRLAFAARYAAEHGFACFTTTLTISPHKNAEAINRIGQAIAADHGLAFLAENFKKRGGFQRSVELSKKLGLYRQDYCGCLFSRRRIDK